MKCFNLIANLTSQSNICGFAVTNRPPVKFGFFVPRVSVLSRPDRLFDRLRFQFSKHNYQRESPRASEPADRKRLVGSSGWANGYYWRSKCSERRFTISFFSSTTASVFRRLLEGAYSFPNSTCRYVSVFNPNVDVNFPFSFGVGKFQCLNSFLWLLCCNYCFLLIVVAESKNQHTIDLSYLIFCRGCWGRIRIGVQAQEISWLGKYLCNLCY